MFNSRRRMQLSVMMLVLCTCVSCNMVSLSEVGNPITTLTGVSPIEERDNPLAGTRWQLAAISEQPSAIPADTTPVIEFSKDTLVFTAGCNNVAAGYFVQGEEIAVQPNVRLFVNCPGELGEAAMLLENTFDAALSSFDTFTLQGEELTIRYATGEMFLRRLSNVSSTTSGTVTPQPANPVSAIGEPTIQALPLATRLPPNPTTVAILIAMEEDSQALLTFMISTPGLRAMFGGVYLDHPSGDPTDVTESRTVLQLVATEDEAAEIREQLPPLIFPERLQLQLVSCTEAHLQGLYEQLQQSPEIGEWMSALVLDIRHNRVGLMVRPSPNWVEVNGLIDKSSLPGELAQLVGDDCIEVWSGTTEAEE